MKRIGFLSFGHWQAVRGTHTPTAREAIQQTVELAVAAEELGIDGAYLRVHHFARQISSPFPILAAIAASTSRIEMGTAVIDMRYENPLYLAELAATTDLLSDGRLELGVSRGSPEPSIRGSETFGYVPKDGTTDADLAREHTALFLAAIGGAGVAQANPQIAGNSGALPILPQSPGLSGRIWWGSGTRQSAVWTAEQGLNLQSSTLLSEDTGVPFGDLQAEQIALYREAWAKAGWKREPRVSVSRSILPIVNDTDRAYFGGMHRGEQGDQVGYLDGTLARFGRSYVGEPDALVAELLQDAAVREADTVLITVPNQLGVDYNAHLLETIAKHIAPALGWSPTLSETGPAS